MVKVNDIRWQLATKHEYCNHVTDKSGCKMLAIINASFVADEASLIFENGKTASNGEEFVAIIKDSYDESVEEGVEWAWTTTYAYAVKPTKIRTPKMETTK